MSGPAMVTLLLAAATLVVPDSPAAVSTRLGALPARMAVVSDGRRRSPPGHRLGGWPKAWLDHLPGRRAAPDSFALAGCWGLLAACLRGGLPVALSVRLVAPGLPEPAREAMRRTAELLALGADPEQAWQSALACPSTAELARGARRTARSGAALAGVAEALAVELRGEANDRAEARAERAAVAVTGPLGLCFLPAFLCLGVIPVVVGLATRLMSSW